MRKLLLSIFTAFTLIFPISSYAMTARIIAVNPDKIVVKMDKGSYVAGILTGRAAVYEGDTVTNVHDTVGIQKWKDKNTEMTFSVYVEDTWVSRQTAMEYFYTPSSLLSKDH